MFSVHDRQAHRSCYFQQLTIKRGHDGVGIEPGYALVFRTWTEHVSAGQLLQEMKTSVNRHRTELVSVFQNAHIVCKI